MKQITPMLPHGDFSKFHVITVLSNPRNFKSRYENYTVFEESILRKGAHLWTVEVCTGAREPRVTTFDNHHHIQLFQTAIEGEVWLKEKLTNIAFMFVLRHSPDARYFMTTDADLLFENDALEKTLQALQTWPVVQAWSQLINKDHEGHTINVFNSFVYCRKKGLNIPKGDYPAKWGSPGGAWAFRRELLNQIGCAISGPIIDFAIAGSGDTYFAYSCFGEIEKVQHFKKFHPAYQKWLKQYCAHLDWILQKNVHYVSNTIRHEYHGSYKTRGYDWRNDILIKHQFNPETDLTVDASGLWRLVIRDERQMAIRDLLREYFESRKEDACPPDRRYN